MGPAPSKVLPNLWQGSAAAFQDLFVYDEKISHIVSACEMTAPKEMKLERLHFNFPDASDSFLLPYFKESVIFIHRARLNGTGVFIHCVMGMSRSSTFTLAYLMTILDLSFDKCFSILMKARSIAQPNPGFMDQLRVFEDSEPGGRKEVRELLLAMPGSAELMAADLQYVRDAKFYDDAPIPITSPELLEAMENGLDAFDLLAQAGTSLGGDDGDEDDER